MFQALFIFWANVLVGKYLSGQMAFWANVLLGKRPSGQMSSGQMSFWANVFLGKRLMGKRLMGKFLSGQMSFWANVFWANVSGQMSYVQMSGHRSIRSVSVTSLLSKKIPFSSCLLPFRVTSLFWAARSKHQSFCQQRKMKQTVKRNKTRRRAWWQT
jgi:hypothetical protein